MKTMKKIKRESKKLNNNNLEYEFSSFEDMLQIIGYRAADRMIKNKERQRLFDQKLKETKNPL